MGRLHDREVGAPHGPTNLADIVDGARRPAAREPRQLPGTDLAPVDRFHHRGAEATRELAALAAVGPVTRVLDIGGGLGGSARALAQAVGCRVTVLELTDALCRVGEQLARGAGLADRVSFKVGSPTDVPAADGSVDVVWTQHGTMTVADTPRLYAEAARVLRPGGRLAMHEVVAGDAGPPHFPVPWAADASSSHLVHADALRAAVAAAGLRERTWTDVTELSLAWLRARRGAGAGGGGRPGLRLLIGDLFAPALANQIRNLEEGRVAVVQAVFEKPAV